MSHMAPELDRLRLAKCLSLLSSDSDGEVLAAARAADRLIRNAGLQWVQILLSPSLASHAPPPPPPPREPSRPPAPVWLLSDWPEHARDAVDYLHEDDTLSVWEIQFVARLRTYTRRPSDKQLGILFELTRRVVEAAQ